MVTIKILFKYFEIDKNLYKSFIYIKFKMIIFNFYRMYDFSFSLHRLFFFYFYFLKFK